MAGPATAASNRPSSRVERRLLREGSVCVVGIDEVGRGAWAGPVTAAAVVWDKHMPIRGVRDSKLLTPEARAKLAAVLQPQVAHGIGHSSPREIDGLGMTGALRLAALRALAALHAGHDVVPDRAIMDGKVDFLAGILATECIVAADRRCTSVAAASILAKVARDALMVRAHDGFPGFGFAANKGYPAPVHVEALANDGPTDLHRYTWAPIREALGLGEFERGPCLLPPEGEPTLF